MFINRNILHFSLIFSSLFSVERSIIPLFDTYETIESLSKSKYSKNQFEEIEGALNRKDEKIAGPSRYNVLFNLYEEKLDPLYHWEARCPRLIETIETMDPDILAVQELYGSQLDDLLPSLNRPMHSLRAKKTKENSLPSFSKKSASS